MSWTKMALDYNHLLKIFLENCHQSHLIDNQEVSQVIMNPNIQMNRLMFILNLHLKINKTLRIIVLNTQNSQKIRKYLKMKNQYWESTLLINNLALKTFTGNLSQNQIINNLNGHLQANMEEKNLRILEES